MTKKIKLTKGKYALVDDADFAYLSQWKWYCTSAGYAARKPWKQSICYMHRVIASTPKGMETDHINLSRLDNRRANLRTCTTSENMMNRDRPSNNTSSFKNVYRHPINPKWIAQMKLQGKTKYIGSFDTKEEAALAHDKAIRKQYKEFGRPNLPEAT